MKNNILRKKDREQILALSQLLPDTNIIINKYKTVTGKYILDNPQIFIANYDNLTEEEKEKNLAFLEYNYEPFVKYKVPMQRIDILKEKHHKINLEAYFKKYGRKKYQDKYINYLKVQQDRVKKIA